MSLIKVSHHPPMVAQYCEGKQWICWQEFTMTSKFRGKYLQVVPMGTAHCQFTNSGIIQFIVYFNHFQFVKQVHMSRDKFLSLAVSARVLMATYSNISSGIRIYCISNFHILFIFYFMRSKKVEIII